MTKDQVGSSVWAICHLEVVVLCVCVWEGRKDYLPAQHHSLINKWVSLSIDIVAVNHAVRLCCVSCGLWQDCVSVLHTLHSIITQGLDSWLKCCGFEPQSIFISKVNSVPTQLLRWQLTAKHTCTPCMWLWIKWRCKLVHGCMVCTEIAPRQQHVHVAPAM